MRLRATGLLLCCLACATRAPAPAALPAPRATTAEKVSFCAGTVTEDDVHRCSWQLTPAQQRRRSYSQRLLFRGSELLRLDTVSGSGAPQGLSSLYEYREGRIVGWSLENRNGVSKGRNVVSGDALWVRWLDEQDRPRVREKTRVSGVRRVLDERRRVASFAWVDSLGKPETDGEVHDTRLQHDARSGIVERRFFGTRGEPVKDREGAHRIQYALDARKLELERRHFDAQGQPALALGAHLVRTSYDAFGNPAEVTYFDPHGRAARQTTWGAAALRYGRDERGNETSLALLDEQGQPLVGSAGWATRRQRFDDQDFVVETSYFGAQGEPVRERQLGAASRQRTLGERGNVLGELLFDEKGEPTLGAVGYHRLEMGYDQRDNPTSYAYSDVSGMPVVTSDGYAARQLYYDGDRLTREEYLDAEGKPVLIAQGYSAYEVFYEEDGSEGGKRYFDASGVQQVNCAGSAPAELQSELAERAGSTRSCYERLLRFGSKAEGKLLIEVSIDRRGQVLVAKLVEDEIDDGSLSACVLSTMRVPYLSKSEGECATVRVPVRFRQKR